ncbi:MAG TPA: integration host factor, actinobacterial type [Pseudonocardiaceae bacterium]|jgi:hypothetical protein
MAVPVPTPEQRTAALAAAKETRKAQAEVIASVRSGEQTVPRLLLATTPDPVVAKIRVAQLLNAVPGLSSARVVVLMDKAGIGPSRRVGGLSVQQRAALLDALS